MIENDADDRYLTKEMFLSQGFDADVDFIDSNALQPYLGNQHNKPHLVILDCDARLHSFTNLIKEIRRTASYQFIPVVVLSNTSRPEDVQESYSCGANSYITKPADYEGALFKISSFINYWFQTVELPGA
jgi:two-component system, response regulator